MVVFSSSYKAASAAAIQRAWYEGAGWLWVLRPIEWLFRAAVSVRRALYRRQWLPVYRAPVPVVVVGNITVGGTGKTPAVIALVQALTDANITVGVVSRGYGASCSSFPHRVNAQDTAQTVGDEPLLIFRRCNVPVVIDPKRGNAARTLVEAGEVDLIISDDGLQHYALARDFEIALYDAEAEFGNGRCLPAGPLREPLTRLQSVDEVLLRSAEESPQTLSVLPDMLVNVETGEQRSLIDHGLGHQITAFAGIALPALFFSQLQSLGFKVQTVCFPDHHRYTRQDFADRGRQPVIMTEKDAVKCGGMGLANAWYLRVSAQLPTHVVERVSGLALTNKTG